MCLDGSTHVRCRRVKGNCIFIIWKFSFLHTIHPSPSIFIATAAGHRIFACMKFASKTPKVFDTHATAVAPSQTAAATAIYIYYTRSNRAAMVHCKFVDDDFFCVCISVGPIRYAVYVMCMIW